MGRFVKLGELAEVAHLGTAERDRYERSLKHYRDTIDVFETAKEDGYAEGRAEGRRHHTLIPCGGLQMLSACFFVLLIN